MPSSRGGNREKNPSLRGKPDIKSATATARPRATLPRIILKESYKKIRAFNDTLIKKSLELNGTITGEHGVGLHKKEYLLEQHPDNIPVMKSIKRTLDPNNIMNPGKIFDLN